MDIPVALGAPQDVAYSPDGRWLAVGAMLGTVHLWQVADGARVATLAGAPAAITRVVFSPGGDALAAGAHDGAIRLWTLPGGALVQTLVAHRAGISDLAFAPDGRRLASGSDDGTWAIWAFPGNAPTVGGPSNLGLGAPTPTHLALSPDGATLAVGTLESQLQLWNALSGGQGPGVQTRHGITSLVFGSGWLILGHLAGGLTPATLQGNRLHLADPVANAHAREVLALALAPDGRWLASSGRDGAVRLWPLAPHGAGVRLGSPRLLAQDGAVRRLAFAPDGATLAGVAVSPVHRVVLWRVADGTLLPTPGA